MTADTITVETPAPFVALVRLARPPVNALDLATRQALVDVLDRLEEQEDVRAIVLTGQGHVFCAGADIREKQALQATAGQRARADRLTRDLFFRLIDGRCPVIAAVNGAAMGAGFVLAACCDMILAATTAQFAMPEIDVGQAGGASFLQRVLPPAKVRRMLLTAERVPAEELYRLGAVEACLPQDELLPAAVALASTIAGKSPAAVRRMRGSFPAVEALGLRDGFRIEQDYTAELGSTVDAAEARRAFLEKRSPVFGTKGS